MVQCFCNLERSAYILIFEQIVIFLIFGLWKINIIQIILSFLLVSLLVTLCSICRVSFSSKCRWNLLFLVIERIISNSVCFLSGLRCKECVLVMWKKKAAIFYSIGWLQRKLIFVSVVVGFPVNVYFKFSVSVCYCQIEKGYGIVFFVSYCVFCLYTGLFINPSGISELDCATTKTDTAERSISRDRERERHSKFLS